jgi:hypothetical protein
LAFQFIDFEKYRSSKTAAQCLVWMKLPISEVLPKTGTLEVYHVEKPLFCPFSIVFLQVVSMNNSPA